MNEECLMSTTDDCDENLSVYESEQLRAIEAWKKEEPSVVNKALGLVVEPLAWLVQKVVPESAIMGALSASNSAAVWMTDTADILRDGRVEKINDLIGKDLKLSDGMSDQVQNWAIGIGVAEGAGTGFFGILGAPVDVPAIITLALRTIHKIGVCYGYECKTPTDEQFVYGILSASGANSIEEKLIALTTLTAIETIILKQTWKAMAEKAAQAQFSKEAAIITLRNLAKQLGVNITKRKALSAIPAIGALIGGSVNGWYIKDVGWAARRSFQQRWLKDCRKIDGEK
jgi:hypothetical protein